MDQVVIPGTWTTDAKGKPVLTPSPGPLEDALTDLFWSLAGGSLPGVSIDLDVTGIKLKPKPKVKKKTGVKSLKLNAKFVFVVTATGGGETLSVKVTVAYQGKG